MRRNLVVSLLLLLALPAFADQVILKNGDKLTGTIAKSDGKTLVLKTDYAGDLTIKFDAIQSFTTAGDLNVTAGGKTAVGPVTTTGDQIVVATRTGGSVQEPLASVTILRSPAEEAAYQKTLHPGWGQGWGGGGNLGFALTAGNSETKNLNIGVNATRTGLHDKLILSETTIYATTTSNTDPKLTTTTANSNDGSIRYDHDFARRVFGFVSGDFFNNSLQHLDLRYILGGGIGFHAIKTPNTTLDLLAGINYTHESFSGLPEPNPIPPPTTITYNHSDSSAALTVGDNFTHKIGKNSMFTQSFLLFPSFSQVNVNPAEIAGFASPDNQRILRGNFNLGFNTKIYKWLGWQLTFNDVFDNHPLAAVPPVERNDITLSTGLSFSFTH